MQTEMYYHSDDVRAAATGRWALVIGALAPMLEPALRKIGKHVSCPVHGGKDGFRLFKRDFNEKGGGICNTCGPKHDGFELLMWVNNWTFWEASQEVGRTLGIEPRRRRYKPAESERRVPTPHSAQTSNSSKEEEENRAKDLRNPPKQSLEERSATWLVNLQERLAQQKTKSSAQAIKSIERVWEECVPFESPSAGPAWRYLASRGLALKRSQDWLGGDCLRFHPALPYYEEEEVVIETGGEVRTEDKVVCKGRFPALVCAIRSQTGELITLHRTYLTHTGKKARVGEPRKMMVVPDNREVVGGAIRLGYPHNGVIGVAEGLETALSGYRASGIPTWSLVSTTLLEGFLPPEEVHTVIIWADKDRSFAGERSANALKTRLEARGLKVFVLLPAQPIPARAKGVDWNDVLQLQGLLGFPNLRRLRAELFREELAYGTH